MLDIHCEMYIIQSSMVSYLADMHCRRYRRPY